MVVRVFPEEQAALPHFATLRLGLILQGYGTPLFLSWYAITGSPSGPIAIELSEPTFPAISTAVIIFPEEQAPLPHFATLRLLLVTSQYETTGVPSEPFAIEVPLQTS